MKQFLYFMSFLCYSASLSAFELDYDGPLSIVMWHSLSQEAEPNWTFRGEISVQNVATSNVALQQSHLDSASINKLKNLVIKDGYYRLKAVVKTSQGREVEFFSFVKACSLIETQLTDLLTVSVDHEGSVIAVTLSTPLSSCGSVNFENIPSTFNTTVDFRTIEQGPVPDTASYIQKIEREREARERGETKDNRSFLAKYWMYILPVIIFVVLSGATNPEAGAAGTR
ncbi:ER membrane protein complex subunit 10 [Lycorma delicatula]|uniref:ER membrane protein complex subunit 10 n=1 Tax=Lycorma delicatula TaxID=130591 RepID=UPI003F515CD5